MWFVSSEDVPKNLNESLSETVLSTLDADAVLRSVQCLLQKMRIALDRIASDLNNANGDMTDNFLQSRDFVNAVLYEVTSAMNEFQVLKRVDSGIVVVSLCFLFFRSRHTLQFRVISCLHWWYQRVSLL